MPHQKIVIKQTFNQPVNEIYAHLSDHNRLGSVLRAPVKRIEDGQDSPNGVGSVRRVGPAILGLQETVTAARPDRSIEYRISKGGAPLKNHRGQLDFSEAGQGSRVTWTIEFDAPPVVGGVIAKVLDGVISSGLKRIA